MRKTAAGSAVAALVLALFWGNWVQNFLPTWKGFWGGARKEDFVCKS